MLRFAIKTVGILVALFLLLTSYAAFSIWSFSNENQLVKTDAAVVLGAAIWGDAPSPVFEERINHAIWLYQHDYVNFLIFTGGKGDGDQ